MGQGRWARGWGIIRQFLLASLLVLGSALGSLQAARQEIRGTLEAIISDDFVHRRSDITDFLLEEKTGQRFRLRSSRPIPENARNRQVKLMGDFSGSEIVVADNAAGEPDVTPLTPLAAPAIGAAVTGAQNTLVILGNMQDATLGVTAAQVNALVFAAAPATSINALFREITGDQMWLTGQVAGPYPISYTATTCNYTTWGNALDAAAQSAGINVSAYSRKIYVFPDQTSVPCGGSIGYGTIGGNTSWILWGAYSDVYAHELGHNFSMQHARTMDDSNNIDDYGDISDFMGYGTGALRQVNAGHRDQVGWLSAARTTTVSSGGTFTIAPLEWSPSSTSLPQALKIRKNNTNEYYYISYRQPLGFDSGLSSGYTSGAQIHIYKGDGSSNYTSLRRTMTDGNVFSDGTNQITITQMSHDANGVDLQVAFGSDTTAPTVAVTAPAASASLSNTVTVSASASDNVSVAGVQFKLDGANLGSEDTSAPYSVSWNTTLASNGAHTLTATARDGGGNTATSAGVAVTVSNADTTAPVISAIATSPVTNVAATIGWTTNESADSQVEFGSSAAYGNSTTLAGTLVTLHSQALSGLSPLTLYHFRVKSRDGSGNLATSADQTFTTLAAPDTTPPTVSVTAPASGATVSQSVLVTASASDNIAVAGVQFKLDGADLGAEDTSAPYFTSWNTALAAAGAHTLTATARDGAGNSATSAGVAVTVDNSIPPVSVAAIEAYAYPDPALDGTPPVIRAVLGQVDTIQLTIRDLTGQVVYSDEYPAIPSGILGNEAYYDFTWRQSVPSGRYFALVVGKTGSSAKEVKTKFRVVN